MSSNRDARRAGLQEAIETIEKSLIHGSRREARALLQDLFHRKIDRDLLPQVASLMRLADFSEKAIQLLHRYVRPSESSPEQATPLEKAVYAASLAELGVTFEARKILDELDPEKLPRVYFYKALTYIRSWEWNEAVPLFEANARHPKVDDYGRLAAQIWLGGALTMGRGNHVRSQKLLERALASTGADHRRFLRKHGLRFLAQNHFYQRNFKPALEAVRQLEELAQLDNDSQFINIGQMWRAMIEYGAGSASAKKGDAKAFAAKMRALTQAFQRGRLWEDARECEFLRAAVLRDEELLLKLYAGTPFTDFRGRLAKLLKNSSQLPLYYDWPLTAETPAQVLDVSNGQNTFGSAYLKEGQIQQRLLQVLATDFYRPLKIPEIHERLYPGDYFNPASSPDRVHQAMRRLRFWLKRAKVPITIQEDHGFYALASAEALALRISVLVPAQAKAPLGVKLLQYVARVEERYGEREFGAGEFARALKISHPSAVRFLRAAVEGGLVARKGAGPATRYRITH